MSTSYATAGACTNLISTSTSNIWTCGAAICWTRCLLANPWPYKSLRTLSSTSARSYHPDRYYTLLTLGDHNRERGCQRTRGAFASISTPDSNSLVTLSATALVSPQFAQTLPIPLAFALPYLRKASKDSAPPLLRRSRWPDSLQVLLTPRIQDIPGPDRPLCRPNPPPPLPHTPAAAFPPCRGHGPIRNSPWHLLPPRGDGLRSVERVTDNLETSSLDDRTYRVVRLPNQLEALLVHDPSTDKASAAMDVNAGGFSDEEDMPGMAHAVEHVRNPLPRPSIAECLKLVPSTLLKLTYISR